MNKKLIQQLLDDADTRLEIAIAFGQAVGPARSLYDDLMIKALCELSGTLVKGDMITVQISEYMWVRGEYVRTKPDGKVEVLSASGGPYTGKRVDLVIKDHEGETT